MSGIDVFRPGGNGAALVPVEIVERLLVRPLLVLPVLLCLLKMDQCSEDNFPSDLIFFVCFSLKICFYLAGGDMDLALAHLLADLVHNVSWM